jgi:hypothetical protein
LIATDVVVRRPIVSRGKWREYRGTEWSRLSPDRERLSLSFCASFFLFYACALCFDSDLDLDRDNAMIYARRISADSVGALTRGTGHICSALYYVDGSERTSRKRDRCSMLSPVVYVPRDATVPAKDRQCHILGSVSLQRGINSTLEGYRQLVPKSGCGIRIAGFYVY